jgi:hypothetical protein
MLKTSAVVEPARIHTAIQFPAVVFDLKARNADAVVPASTLVCCTRAILPEPDVTVKFTPLLATPLSVTTTLPEVAAVGTGTTMLVALQLNGVAVVPLNVTALVPCDAPKLAPVIVTELPVGPKLGLKLVILGGAVTPKSTPLLGTPPTFTSRLPVVAPVGTGAVMLVSVQFEALVWTPLNVTKLWIVPTVGPKFVPVMVTFVPIGPELGLMLVIAGGGVTVKTRPLLATPATVTTTFPVVAPEGTATSMADAVQLEVVAGVPLNVTVLLPCGDPKFDPLIVRTAPTGP